VLLHTLAARSPPSILRWIGRQSFRPFIGPVVQRFASSLRDGPVEISHGYAKGLQINPSGANPGYGLGTTELAIQMLFCAFIAEGDVIWDVGACIGFFTLLAARLVGERGRVIAIEPIPDNASALHANLELNGFTNVAVVASAASDHSGSATMHKLDEQPTWAKLDTAETDFGQGRSGNAMEVPLTTLDGLLDDHPAPALVKIDVEGAEVAALRGADRLMREARPVVVCECHGTNAHVAELLEAKGYVLRVVGSDEPLRSASWDAHVLAVPGGGFGRASAIAS
jgi:FkbM family methyltransferase